MAYFELNIGLLVGDDPQSAANTWGEIRRRYEEIRAKLREQFDGMVRFHYAEEPTLVVVSCTNNTAAMEGMVYMLSVMFDQDCIAVYYPSFRSGQLVGPKADEWGDFRLDRFVRF